MRLVYRCWRRICREINVLFSRFVYQIFYSLCPIVTYLLTSLRVTPAGETTENASRSPVLRAELFTRNLHNVTIRSRYPVSSSRKNVWHDIVT
jgi:hypothetical protein